MDIVIVGVGGAGASAIQSIREEDRKSRIIAISRENKPPYTPVFLADYLLGEDESKLYIFGRDFFERFNVEFINDEVVKVDDRVVLKSGKEIEFDKLLISTGSKPFIPPVKGVESDRIFTFLNLSDANRIRSVLKHSKKSAIIGAGPVGLELAYSLKKLGVDVVVIEMMESVLPGLVGREIADMIKKEFERSGIKIRTSSRVEGFEEDSKLSVFTEDYEFNVDFAVLSTGVRPNLPEIKGVKVRQGIVVNEKMESTRKGIYCAGDIAEAKDVFGNYCLTPTWTSAVYEGSIAGKNIVGGNAIYDGSIRVNIIKKSNLPVISIGMTSGEEEEYQGVRVFRKAFFEGERLVGFQSAGSYSDLNLSGVIQMIIKKGVAIRDRARFLRNPSSLIRQLRCKFVSLS